MQAYKGSCHCGRVVFEVKADIQRLSECNCSMCCKKGIMHHPIDNEHFTLIKGKNSLSLYQFGTNQARHWFCKVCGIHPFGRPRMNPNRYTINVRCLDGFDEIIKNTTQTIFNGQQHPHDHKDFRSDV